MASDHLPRPLGYRPEVDGLRAVAVVAVILYHAHVPWFDGGFVGVDVFFVISGFLISRIIHEGMKRGTFSLARFYERRARRILPALFLVCLVTLPFAWRLMMPTEFKDYAKSLVAVAGFVSNFLFWQQRGYFAPESELKPLLHTWSLSVEEQFYLLFPIFLLVLTKMPRRWLLLCLSAGCLASFLLSEWASARTSAAGFYLLPFRAWELGVGALIAISEMDRRVVSDRYAQLGSAAGLAAVLLAIVVLNEGTPFPGAWALLPVLGTAAIIALSRSGGLVTWALSLPPLVGIGLISYSAYLWHFPLFAFAKLHFATGLDATHYAALIVMTFGLAYLTWKYVEVPFRTVAMPTRRVLLRAGGATAALAGVGGVLLLSGLQEQEILRSLTAEQRKLYATMTQNHRGGTIGDGACVFSATELTEQVRGRFSACAAVHGPAAVIFGDSHAANLFNSVAAHSEGGFVFGYVRASCRPSQERNECQLDAFERFVSENSADVAVVYYEQAGFTLVTDEYGRNGARNLFRRPTVPGYPVNVAAVDMAKAYLERLDETVPVVWVGPRIEPYIAQSQMLRADCRSPDVQLRPGLEEVFRGVDAELGHRLQASIVEYISQIDFLQFDPTFDLFSCTEVFWEDDDHFSRAGERHFGQRIMAGLELQQRLRSPSRQL